MELMLSFSHTHKHTQPLRGAASSGVRAAQVRGGRALVLRAAGEGAGDEDPFANMSEAERKEYEAMLEEARRIQVSTCPA